MSKLHRYFAPGQSCFITAVTAQRQRILYQHSRLLLRAICRAKRKSRFKLVAWVILPDHIHAIIDCPDADAAKIVQRFKLSFSRLWQEQTRSAGPVWQHRFWDHIIRSPEDLKRHIDYIHLNPAKHGIVDAPTSRSQSSFHSHLRKGHQGGSWGDLLVAGNDDLFGE